ncbi:type IX secretion system sortase PorU [uncultured Nonlabens sp.]|uniref:type IX secretion system sortase PorU n=1 Tax=uncultured Nonlabens sp. TaxID=859306 RepID=UPI0026323C0D|nr:type IX secretion system sortase PorU [uncultured Nonlabens sp.]
MKRFFFLIIIFFYANAIAQSGRELIDWKELESFDLGSQQIKVPYFTQNHSFDGQNLFWRKSFESNQKIDELSLEISSLQTETCSVAELGQLNRSQIPNGFQYSLSNALSRKRNYAQLTISPIFKDGNKFKKVISFNYSYSYASTQVQVKNASFGNSILASGNWYRFKVERTGVNRISRSFLSNLGIDVNSIDPSRIKIYGHGGTSLPLVNSDDQFFDAPEVAITVTGSEDGRFDNRDQILFYGIATDTDYVRENDSFINPYSNESFYYLTVDGALGKRILPFVQPSAVPDTAYDYYYARKHHEEDLVNIASTGRVWYGERFDFEPEQVFDFDFENVISSLPAVVRIATGAVSDNDTSMSFSLNNEALGTSSFRGVAGQNIRAADRETLLVSNVNLSSDMVSITVSYDNSGNPGASGYLDYISLEIPQSLTGRNEQFRFYVPNAVSQRGVVEYQFSNAAQISEVWDITDVYNVRKVTNDLQDATFSFTDNGGQTKEYLAVDSLDFYNVVSVRNSAVVNQNLKGTIFNDRSGNFRDIDYLIITSQFLQSEAQRLANYHIMESNLNTKVVTLQEIYNEFSEGRQDISAIRNFVRYVYDNASSPSNRVRYLNLFGDASYDYKDRLRIRDNIVPSYLSLESSSLTTSFCTDDFFAFMDNGEGTVTANNLMDIAVGRMIVSDIQEAREMVDKVINYTAEPAFNKWRNNIALIGDDVDILSDRILQENVNDLGDEIFMNRPDYNINKILLDSYEQFSTAGGPKYPDAVNDIRDAFEQGSLVINYFGHGNEDGLAREFVITRSLVENLRNPETLPLFISVTCEFTRFDNPLRVSGGEMIYLNAKGGAIASVATNRLIFVNVGAGFNNIVDQYIFGYDNVEPVSMAEALRLAKTDPSFQSTSTRRVIAFVGDPALKLASPKPRVVLNTINGNPIATNTDVLQALGRVSLGGEVQTVSGNRIVDYNGTLFVTVFDKNISRETLANDNTRDTAVAGDPIIVLPFDQLGEALFRGQATITNGEFEFDFIMPRDTQIPVGAGRVSFYAKRDNVPEDQNGYSQDIQVGGINRNAPVDDLGPEIELFMNDTNFVSGGVTNSDPFLLALLSDDNGINTSSGIGHDIMAVLDGDETNPFILNDYYQANEDDFTQGEVYFPLRDIEPGLHTLKITAWDTYNNSSMNEIQFVVSESDGVELTRVLNYPNPFSTYTEFWFNHNRPFEPLDVQVQVMTVSGKIVWSKNKNITTTGFTSREITWDGRDDFGQRLGKGVYIYTINVKSTLTNKSASKVEKLVIL